MNSELQRDRSPIEQSKNNFEVNAQPLAVKSKSSSKQEEKIDEEHGIDRVKIRSKKPDKDPFSENEDNRIDEKK